MMTTSTMTKPQTTNPVKRQAAMGALALTGLVLGVSSTFIVAALIGGGTIGSYQLATKIVDAVMAGATAAAIAGLLMTAGLGTAVFATVRWAIGFYGRKKAIS